MWRTIGRFIEFYSALLDSHPGDEKHFTVAVGGGCIMMWPERRRPLMPPERQDGDAEGDRSRAHSVAAAFRSK